jgi:hypothetical protein
MKDKKLMVSKYPQNRGIVDKMTWNNASTTRATSYGQISLVYLRPRITKFMRLVDWADCLAEATPIIGEDQRLKFRITENSVHPCMLG